MLMQRPFQQPLSLSVFALLSVIGAVAQTPIPPLERTGEPQTPIDGDQFGAATAVDGRWLVVGAPSSRTAGEAFVYKRAGSGTWAFEKRLRVSQQNNPWRFGASVAMSSGFVVGGAPYEEDPNDVATGAVHVFYSSDTWRPMDPALQTTGYGQDGDEFGYSVSISGPYIIVGAPGDDIELPEQGLYTDAGQVYVFELGAHEPGKWTWIEYDPNNPNENIIRHAPSPRPYARFGHSVCLSGEYAAVGAPGADEVAVFKRSGTAWARLATLSPDPNDIDFGWSVSISGEYLAVGAPEYENGRGKAYVYRYDRAQAAWVEDLSVAGDSGEDDRFGSSVSIVRLSPDDVKLAVGAPYWDGTQTDEGAVYVYTRTAASDWGDPPQVEQFVTDDHVPQGLFGSSVYLNPESLLVGGPADQGGEPPAGSAYVQFIHEEGEYSVPLDPYDPRLPPDVVVGGATFSDFDRDGWSDLFMLHYQQNGYVAVQFNNIGAGDPLATWKVGYAADFSPGPNMYTYYNSSAGDFDNDGYPDIATEPRTGNGAFRLLRNLGPPFDDRKYDYNNLPDPPSAQDWNFEALDPNDPNDPWYVPDGRGDPSDNQTETACWGDVDGDLDLDLFLPAYNKPGTSLGNFFLWNKWGDERRFYEAAGQPPVGPNRAGLWNTEVGQYPNDQDPEGAQLVDYDFDGDLDLFSSVLLYQNNWNTNPATAEPANPKNPHNGARFFERLAPEESGIVWKEMDEGALFLDYDMDGDFDLAVNYIEGSQEARIWENRGDGTFFDATDSRARFPRLVALPETGDASQYGMSAADWDNDGDIDFTSAGVFRQNMLIESGVARFEKTAFGSDSANVMPSWADVDKDGDLDCAYSRFLWGVLGRSTGMYENTTYDPNTPEPSRRFVRVRPSKYQPGTPPVNCSQYAESEYGAAVEIRVLGDTSGLRRRQFTASSGGYLNQNEYVLTFAVPASPIPETVFDVVVDFPMRSDQGRWRVDKYVNCKLGNIDLADLYDTYREITVWRDGFVCIDDTLYFPDPNDTISPLMLTAGGGLGLPGDPDNPLPLPSTSLGTRVIGLEFTVAQGEEIVIREIVLDGQLDLDPNAPCDDNMVIWKFGVLVEPVEPEWAEAGITSVRNNRSYIPVHMELDAGSYRLLARVTEYRGTTRAGPLQTGAVTLLGGGGFVRADDPLPDICTNPYANSNPDEDTLYLTFRFTELAE